MTFSGEGMIADLGIRLDVSLAGYAAERIFDQETLFPLVERFISAVRRLIERDSPPAADDYSSCVEMVIAEHPDWTDGEILDAMLVAHARITAVLQQRWANVQRLADGLLSAPNLHMNEQRILAAMTPDKKAPG